MAEAPSHVDVWLGSSLGLMKGVTLDPLRCTNYLPGGLSVSQTDKNHEMLCMCRQRETLYVGLRRGVVQAFDSQLKRFTLECDVTSGVGTLVGVARHDQILITCTDRGSLSFWPPEEKKWEREVGKETCCMAVTDSPDSRVATGGRENPLKLWDTSQLSHTPIFTAKNVRPDRLGLRVPVWVNRVVFSPDHSGPQSILVTGTGYGEVRMYDTRAQKRPLLRTEYGGEPITALTMSPDGRYCVAGNSVGELVRFDLRAGGGVAGRYKGFGGGVTAVDVSGDGSILAACGLDRYLRTYSLDRPKLLHQVYVKLQCRCLTIGENYPRANDGGEVQSEGEKEGDDSDEEDVWASMATVGETTRTGNLRNERTNILNPLSFPLHVHES
ncbi:WD repeat-containing protein 74 [Geodia barretti]|uniref:WD repeat-containing protein 74 n=1 Tax=Geodia barretti TaxID=519541 RepID=A0AA35TI74_GEOBA|nr:WD repeat-containing protein 74 [Geodia barretti]